MHQFCVWSISLVGATNGLVNKLQIQLHVFNAMLLLSRALVWCIYQMSWAVPPPDVPLRYTASKSVSKASSRISSDCPNWIFGCSTKICVSANTSWSPWPQLWLKLQKTKHWVGHIKLFMMQNRNISHSCDKKPYEWKSHVQSISHISMDRSLANHLFWLNGLLALQGSILDI